jgi:hypothetical protein
MLVVMPWKINTTFTPDRILVMVITSMSLLLFTQVCPLFGIEAERYKKQINKLKTKEYNKEIMYRSSTYHCSCSSSMALTREAHRATNDL